jgi:hypothetical protein
MLINKFRDFFNGMSDGAHYRTAGRVVFVNFRQQIELLLPSIVWTKLFPNAVTNFTLVHFWRVSVILVENSFVGSTVGFCENVRLRAVDESLSGTCLYLRQQSILCLPFE